MVSRIKRLWHNEQGLEGAAGLLVITMLLSNALGFLRDLILANSLPLPILDTYYAAFRIPDFLFNLFILGAISSAFIPVFLDIKTKDGESAGWHLAHNLVHTALFVLLILGAVLVIFMPQILPLFVPGFAGDKFVQTVALARVLLLSPFFFAISYILGGVLNAHKKFFAYSLAPLVYNLAIIVGGFLTPRFGVQGVVWAVVVGAIAHALIQVPALASLGYRYRFVFAPSDPNLRRVLRLMIPRSISLGMSQIVLIFFTRIGSLLPVGTVSIFALTNNVQTTPTAVFAASIGTAVFPLLGAATSEKDPERYRTLLTHSLKGVLFYMIPSATLLWVLRAHVIRLYLALNHQTWEDTIRAIHTFQWFILALPAQALILVLIRAFYARHDTRRPMVVSMLAGALSVVLALVFVRIYHDVPALSLAFACGVIVEAIVLLGVFLYTHRGLLNIGALIESAAVSSLFGICAALVARLALSVVSEGRFTTTAGLGTAHVVPLFMALFAAALFGIGVYILLAYSFGRNELTWLFPKQAVKTIVLPDSEAVANDEGLA